MKILVTEPIAEEGLERLRCHEDIEVVVELKPEPGRLLELVADCQGLLVRGATKVTREVIEAAGTLRIIGRAGTGVDNIDLAAATEHGVVVVNTPGGNSVSVAELTVGLILACLRRICYADAQLKQGNWVKSECRGNELNGKTLGIVGVGRIGREVARRAAAFGMHLLGHDPFLPAEKIAELGLEAVELPELLERSHVVSLHLPLTDKSRNLIGREQIAAMRPGAVLVNAARGGLVDEAALLAALQEGHLAGAALDAFAGEPEPLPELVRHPRVVATPHIGASTCEAQEHVGYYVAGSVLEYLLTGTVRNAVNYPSISPEQMKLLRPYLVLASRLGAFTAQVARGRMRRLRVTYHGELAGARYSLLSDRALCGALRPFLHGEAVNPINARALAEDRGLALVEAAVAGRERAPGHMELELEATEGQVTVVGTASDEGRPPRLLEVDGLTLDAPLQGDCIFLRPADVPGVVGSVGTVLAQAGINIHNLALQTDGRGGAVSVVNIEGPVTGEVVDRLKQQPGIDFARLVRVP